MSFAYTVRDPLGHTHEGVVEAGSLDEARQSLTREGFQVLTLQEQSLELRILPRRVTRGEIIYVVNQLAIMVETGITLSAALAGVAEQEENPALKEVLIDLKSRVEGGDSFSAALAAHSKHFDQTFIAMVRASEETGALGEMLERIANYMQGQLEIRRKVRAAIAYPAVMLVIAIGVTIFLLAYVLPKFTPMFENRGMDLPAVTRLVVSISAVLTDFWWCWLAAIAVLLAAFVVAKRTERGRRVWDGLKLKIPVIGSAQKKVATSRSIRTLGAMVGSGVGMLDALELSANVAGNSLYRDAWLRVHERVATGDRIAEALRDEPLFPHTLVQMIGAGEETGRLDYVLEKVSGYYDSEVQSALKAATSMIEPVMIAVMGVVVGGIGMALMLPIFQLSSSAG